METSVLVGCAAVVLVLVAGLVVALLRGRARSRRALAAAAAETAELRRRLDDLADRLERISSSHRALVGEAAYVITDAGEPRPEPTVADRVVLSATVGEPMVKVLSFGHGVRRALSAENRNRIRFEMRREIRASRRRRRRETKAFVRQARAAERARDNVNAA